jgi:hypothetical protein
LVRRGHEPKHGADVYDAASTSLAHVGQDPTRYPNRSPKVGLKLTTRLLQTRLFDRASQAEACIVDENVDALGAGDYIFHCTIDALVRAHIEFQHLDAFRRLAGTKLARRSERVIPAGGEERCSGEANAGGCAGNKSDLFVGHG